VTNGREAGTDKLVVEVPKIKNCHLGAVAALSGGGGDGGGRSERVRVYFVILFIPHQCLDGTRSVSCQHGDVHFTNQSFDDHLQRETFCNKIWIFITFAILLTFKMPA